MTWMSAWVGGLDLREREKEVGRQAGKQAGRQAGR